MIFANRHAHGHSGVLFQMVCEPFDRRLCACPQPVQSTARNEVHHFFIDLLAKVLRNFPEASSVALNDPVTLAKEFVRIEKKFDIRIQSCAEGKHLASYGVDISGCMETAFDG